MRRVALGFILFWILGAVAPAFGQSHCENRSFEGYSYTLCVAHADEDVRIFWGEDDKAFGHFSKLRQALETSGQELVFAMNAGMFGTDLAPVGHYVENGRARQKVMTRASPYNFGMLPNGVFCIGAGSFDVVESLRFVKENPSCTYATQSGPMLVIDGQLHPRFLPRSRSRHVRNGVGVSNDKSKAYFVISNNPINFHRFARIFKDELGVDQALFFDGRISRLYAAELGRRDFGRAVGPIVGLIRRKAEE